MIAGYQNGDPIRIGGVAGVTVGAGLVNLQSPNRQSEIAVIGGIVLSLILTLVIVPCAYILYDKFGSWVKRKIGG